MAAAARLALRARPLCRPNPGVAALLLSGEDAPRVVARGWTRAGGRPHAEAIALAGFAGGGANGMTLHVTLEPCAHASLRGPACCDVVANARPRRVVIGQRDPDPRTAGEGIARLEREGIAVTVLDDPASAASLADYLTLRRMGRPRVTLKLALSLDGCIALADGTSRWITGEAARAHVHAMRARHDAILVGGGTWRADRPRLDVRLPGLGPRSPQRLVLTRGAGADGARVINRPADIARLDGVLSVYLEGGAGAASAFLAADLVDELHLYRAPILLGDGLRALDGLGLAGPDGLAGAHGRWERIAACQLGSDSFTAYQRNREEGA
ncbi:bifunctional diaminohydroxyphosphoribosylaminopyrimidine deaminase/5-amino-6-(5-phosphoribosylamino)uracil reductase RibD [Erythrobacter sp. HL-111]|uniref:bifunctional diaminohydroxyphosphoribosylaminopyrimidine deaminase/5-amino-6-(5-phosphoribosylamino)uracil reductase RibD n=1 Tax=Erythrobacter sp. HL-111 TaxID=1798193 RepID=UPI0006D9992F|nr:bifunctional diaminohydroxyphosphoribosylaminopyrimidine deaminase/5-amino-6-(5-phosphoribosylamino)uracil reductase RibD [Erythrobacter sp. HL-111]KPP92937.1 MAG: bifunctional diaminohydroxyphosphoribosylaminopyrimidine deaminase / 5-amino-6-(5-phosphoribosylamino)uracil reductase RibD [Erythrobacteraceae bacterium HL-111]SDT02638.1 diaminohydroxyphosphoribosylaminopyrimidine deaminase / 5-amino-6-(5-phosphoribosylamino)uracil reductase [Erythrobacter sp. HL-111]